MKYSPCFDASKGRPTARGRPMHPFHSPGSMSVVAFPSGLMRHFATVY